MSRPTREETEEALLAHALLSLNAKALGLALGALFGLGIFIATNWLVLEGGHVDAEGHRVVGPNLALLGKFFLGYRVSFLGSFIGFAYGFALGTITGAAIGVIYNKLSSFRISRKTNRADER
jgi:ABC-type nitrate/sulfonate/bicarbonate transport system permease component